MTDTVISIAAKVAEILVYPTIRLGQFLFCANKTTKKLLQKKGELVLEKDRIQRRIDEANRQTEIIEDNVNTWMNQVNNVLQEAARLEGEMEANKCCHQAWCPTWRRYHLCRQMVEKINTMTDLKNNSQFDRFSYITPLPGIEYKSSKDFTFFESTKQAYDQLIEALQDDSTSIIGLYGMGGCGKTTLVTEVGKKAKELKVNESKLFDEVLLVTVSGTPDIRSIQGKMATMLGLKLEEEYEEERAQRLYLRLKREERVLIILDDIWTEFNLKDIGIELNESNKGRHKVLLTTRRQPVFSSMDCEWKIPLELLSQEEAWKLFRMFVGTHDQSSFNKLESLALEVVRECKGLPIAIKAVASTLKGKLNDFQIHEWKVALQKLKNSKPVDVEEGMRDALSCLKLSYDYLRDREAELLFFMCAMFPEDYQIPVEDLIRYGVGFGVCGEFESFDLARSMIQSSLNKLLDSCLLDETSRPWAPFTENFGIGYVKMHDLVRDLALWMASEEDYTIKLNLVEHVNSLVGERDVKDCFTISSQYRKFQETDHQLEGPKLEVLILNSDKPLHLSYASIEGMKGLKVLAIINQFDSFINQSDSLISLLPQPIGSLSNLQTLRLCGWELGDMSFIANLIRLEVLVLQHCHFKVVPDEIEKLSKLKLLELTDCWIEEKYSLKTIERCSQVEELYVFGDAAINFWQCCARFATAPNLQRYNLNGEQFDFEYIATEPFAKRMLRLEGLDDLPMLGDCKNIVPDMEQVVGGLGDLTVLKLEFCSEIEYLIDTTSELGGSFQENAMFDRLIELELKQMGNLKEVCHGAPPADFFKSLNELHITACQQLHNIFPLECNVCNLKILKISGEEYDDEGTNCIAVGLFSMSVAQSLQRIEELTIEGCLNLRHIIANVGGEEISHAPCNFHPMFPSLKKLSIRNCHKLEFIFPISCVGQDGLVKLEEIEVIDADEMKSLFCLDSVIEEESVLPNLSSILLWRLPNFVDIGQGFMIPKLKLQVINIGRCPKFVPNLGATQVIPFCHRTEEKVSMWDITVNQLDRQEMLPPALQAFLNLEELYFEESRVEGILQLQVGNKNAGQSSLNSNLQALHLWKLPELRFIWSGNITVLEFIRLGYVSVNRCPKLKTLFPSGIVGCLQNLEHLRIEECEELEEIIASSHLQQICFPKLWCIRIMKCDKLKCIFSDYMPRHFPSLCDVRIEECCEIERIFGGTRVGDEDDSVVLIRDRFWLMGLPNFAEIGHGIQLRMKPRYYYGVDGCPKYTGQFIWQ